MATKKYDIKFTIRFTGRSKAEPDGTTYMGNLLANCIKTFIQAVKLQWPNVKIESEEETTTVKKFGKNAPKV